MLYLEDYLEIIEHLPQELRDRFTEIREMDLQVHNAMDNLEEEVKQFFLNAKRMKPEQREAEYQKLKQEYYKTLEDADEKVNLANQIYELVDRYLRRLDQELQKFKIELEADNAGITELLERRSLELDNPPPIANHVREKRKYSAAVGGVAAHSSGLYVRDSNTPNSPFLSNNLAGRLNANLYSPQASLVSPGSSASNGNNPLHHPLAGTTLSSQLTPGLGQVASPSPAAHAMPLNQYNHPLGAGNPLAAAASQAIAATQQMQQGRRTASLKASIEAISYTGAQTMLGGDMNSLALSGPSGFALDGPNARRRQRGSSHFHDQEDSSEALRPFEENGTPTEWTSGFGPNEPTYCICNQVSYGEMVACDNEDCQAEWFHYGCVGLTQAPKGKWFCPPCSQMLGDGMRKKQKKAAEKSV